MPPGKMFPEMFPNAKSPKRFALRRNLAGFAQQRETINGDRATLIIPLRQII